MGVVQNKLSLRVSGLQEGNKKYILKIAPDWNVDWTDAMFNLQLVCKWAPLPGIEWTFVCLVWVPLPFNVFYPL